MEGGRKGEREGGREGGRVCANLGDLRAGSTEGGRGEGSSLGNGGAGGVEHGVLDLVRWREGGREGRRGSK